MVAIAKSELQYAGEYLLEECSIISTSGKVYNIFDLIEEINIFENIFSAQVTGNIIISDTTNIIMKAKKTFRTTISFKHFISTLMY